MTHPMLKSCERLGPYFVYYDTLSPLYSRNPDRSDPVKYPPSLLQECFLSFWIDVLHGVILSEQIGIDGPVLVIFFLHLVLR
jgi:hypothetical protein